MERGKKGELPRRRARQGPGERSWGLRAGDQGRSPPQRGRPAGPAGGKDRVAGGGITGLGARRGREVGSREGMRGGRERSGCGSARQRQGQLTSAQLTGNPETVVIFRQRLGTRGVGTGGQCGGSGVPCRGALRGVSLGSERPVERKQVHSGYRARKPGPRALVTGQQTCVQLFFL